MTKERSFVCQRSSVAFAGQPRAAPVVLRWNRGRVCVRSPTSVACGRGKSPRGPSTHLRMINGSVDPEFLFQGSTVFHGQLYFVYKGTGSHRFSPSPSNKNAIPMGTLPRPLAHPPSAAHAWGSLRTLQHPISSAARPGLPRQNTRLFLPEPVPN